MTYETTNIKGTETYVPTYWARRWVSSVPACVWVLSSECHEPCVETATNLSAAAQHKRNRFRGGHSFTQKNSALTKYNGTLDHRFFQVNRICQLYLQNHLSLADMPSAILHSQYVITCHYLSVLCKVWTSSSLALKPIYLPGVNVSCLPPSDCPWLKPLCLTTARVITGAGRFQKVVRLKSNEPKARQSRHRRRRWGWGLSLIHISEPTRPY